MEIININETKSNAKKGRNARKTKKIKNKIKYK